MLSYGLGNIETFHTKSNSPDQPGKYNTYFSHRSELLPAVGGMMDLHAPFSSRPSNNRLKHLIPYRRYFRISPGILHHRLINVDGDIMWETTIKNPTSVVGSNVGVSILS